MNKIIKKSNTNIFVISSRIKLNFEIKYLSFGLKFIIRYRRLLKTLSRLKINLNLMSTCART